MKASLTILTMFILTTPLVKAETQAMGLVSSGCKLTRVQSLQEPCSLKEFEERTGKNEVSNEFLTYVKNVGLILSSKKEAKANLEQSNLSVSIWEGKSE